MVTEVIDGESRELTVIEPREMLADTATPEGTVSLATRMATALKDIVEKQRLYALIQGKKFPQVEAWMTIARMDNVVAREVIGGILRHDDGSYEATVELVRLSDGMVIGRGSALCGSPGDKPWDARPDPAKRSMSVTRATSRAFRQQYSWIMALAGYEPTPAEEMPRDEKPREEEPSGDGSLIGTVTEGKPPVDYELRQERTLGPMAGFKLTQGRKGLQVLAYGALASALQPFLAGLDGQRVQVWGDVVMVDWERDGKSMPPYKRLLLQKIKTDDWILPGQVPFASDEPPEAESETLGLVQDDDLSDLDY